MSGWGIKILFQTDLNYIVHALHISSTCVDRNHSISESIFKLPESVGSRGGAGCFNLWEPDLQKEFRVVEIFSQQYIYKDKLGREHLFSSLPQFRPFPPVSLILHIIPHPPHSSSVPYPTENPHVPRRAENLFTNWLTPNFPDLKFSRRWLWRVASDGLQRRTLVARWGWVPFGF